MSGKAIAYFWFEAPVTAFSGALAELPVLKTRELN